MLQAKAAEAKRVQKRSTYLLRLFGRPCRLFLGPGFRLAARWNRLGETMKTRKKREKNGEEMGEIWPKKCEQGRDRRDQLAPPLLCAFILSPNGI